MARIVVSGNISAPRATIAALCANLVGIGLARFAYTPLIPALIAAGWFTPSAALYLGAANLAGYLAGALAARSIAGRFGTEASLRAAMALTAASLFASAWALGFAWFFVWRFVSGSTGGLLMALAAPTVLPCVPPARRGIAAGAIFTGVGLGIAASGTLVPLLMRYGLVATWMGLGTCATALTLLAWNSWPETSPPVDVEDRTLPVAPAASTALRALYFEYALNAVGLVPHMVFLVDFIARGLGRGLWQGGFYWTLFGCGALVGPIASGYVGDRIGFRAALCLAYAIEAVAVALPTITVARLPLAVSSIVIGAFVPGIVAITIGRTRELLPGDPPRQAAAWSWCTTAFAIGQAAAGYGFSYIFAQTGGSYPALFGLAAAALLLALLLNASAGATMPRRAARERPAVR